MSKTKFLHRVFSFLIMASMLLPGISPASAMPMDPMDETKVPHYVGPNPNWANSPFTLPDVAVEIVGVGGGTGATAEATVGVDGKITGITVTDPGSGYTAADVIITSGAGAGALASANVITSGIVTAITVDDPGGGYVRPVVEITLGGATVQATASAFGGVDAVTLDDPGSGYQMPTVDFDLPDDPNGAPAHGHIVCAETDCIPVPPATTVTIVDIMVDNPGSGYSAAPKVVIRDGTLFDPINNGAAGALATAYLSIQSVSLDTFGEGYTSEPNVEIFEDNPLDPGIGALAHATVTAGGVTSIDILDSGSGYITGGGMEKFIDALPLLCDPLGALGPVCPDYTNPLNANAKYIPVGVPDGSNLWEPSCAVTPRLTRPAPRPDLAAAAPTPGASASRSKTS